MENLDENLEKSNSLDDRTVWGIQPRRRCCDSGPATGLANTCRSDDVIIRHDDAR